MATKPTVIGQKPTSIKPTAMPGSKVVADNVVSGAIKPAPVPTTVVSSHIEMKEVATVPHVVSASKLPGVVRAPLKVSRELLERRFVGYDITTLNEVENALSEVTLEVFGEIQISHYGLAVQQSYASGVDEWHALVNKDVVRHAPRHIARLQVLLSEVADTLSERSWFKKTSPTAKFEQVRPEVENLKVLLNNCCSELETTRNSMAQLLEDTGKLHKTATAYALACEYLAAEIGGDKGSLLTERSISIGSTVANLQTQHVLIDQNKQQLDTLLKRIRDGVLTSLPAWITVVLTATNDELNDTKRYLLKDQLMAVIRNLTI